MLRYVILFDNVLNIYGKNLLEIGKIFDLR